MINAFILLQKTAVDIGSGPWSVFATQALITISIAILLMFVSNLLKPVFNRTDERFKTLEDRQNQADKERDELGKDINAVRSDLQKSDTSHLLALNDIKHQYSELMKIFQLVEASNKKMENSNKEEKDYLKNLIEMLQKREVK